MARKVNLLKNYEYVTREAMTDEGMGARYACYFHCFNPNGAYAQLKAMHARIDAWIDAHPERPNGVLFVFGSLNDFNRKQLFNVLDLISKRRAHAWPLAYAVRKIREDIVRADNFIADPAEWPDTKENLEAAALAAQGASPHP